MKKVLVALAVMLSMAVPAFAVDFAFHGDLNHRFRLYSNQEGMFAGTGNAYETNIINDDNTSDFAGEFKYRLWMTATSDDGAIKGVYAMEVGGIRFGEEGKGGTFSGDGVNIETRWAYTDFALGNGRTRIGLMPINVNKFLWNETVTGVDYKVAVGDGDLTVAWYRGYEVQNTTDNDFKDLDAFYARYNLKPADGTKVGFFALWQTSDADTVSDDPEEPNNYVKDFAGLDMDLYTLGVDGSYAAGDLFANWDLMYQFGDLVEDYDFGGYFAHVDLGVKINKGKLTYTFWYASGDDDADDDDLDAFVSTDVDINSQYSVVLFEGYMDDDYFSETPYLQDKGLILNRIGYDYQVNDKLKVGAAALYLLTAEDVEYTDDNGVNRSEDSIGFEFDTYASYKLFSNTEVAIQLGYLVADDAMDAYEADCDGKSDEDIFVTNMRLRYKF